MWMMKSCYSSSDQHKMSTTTSTNNMSGESFNGRRLRPLIPRVPSAASSDLSSSSSTVANSNNRSAPQKHGSCFGRLNDTAADPLTLNHIYQVDHNNKKPICTNTGGGGGGGGGVIASSRWNPTPEQLRTLEELYGRGTRTPSADQIQHITSQLRRYGKIEGKNVFYWFQNHKARERQKRRREIECTVSPTPPRNNNNNKNNIFEANPSSTYDEEMLNYDNHPNHRGGGEGGVPDSSIIARKQTSTVRGGGERLGSMRTELFHDVENHETMNWACSLNYSSAAAAAAAPAPAPPAASYSYLQEYSRDVLKILHDNPMETRTAKANDVDSGDDRGNRDQHHYHVHDHDDHVHGWIKVQDEDEDEEEKGMEVEEGEFQFQFKFQPTRNLSASERNSRCHMQNHLSSSTFHSRPLPFPSAAAATTITATTTTATSTESATTPITTIHPPFYYFNNTYNYNNIIATTAATPSFTLSNLADAMHRNFLTSPTTAAITTNSMTNYMGKSLDDHNNNISSSASSQTLQLFPLESPVSGGMDDGEAMVEPEEERETPAVFFEFLPLKE